MKTIILFISLTLFVYASYPRAYSALGDVIYENVDKIEKLQDLEEYKLYTQEIQEYVSKVQKTKEKGFMLENPESSVDKKEYLSSLRALSKQHDFFLRTANANYKKSLDEQNSRLFSKLINSGLIDTQKNKEEIMEYYFKHSEDINASGVIQSYLDEDAKLKAKRDAAAARYKSKKMIEAQKIKRLRQNDIQEQEELERKLQEEVSKKKKEIRQNQKRELRL